MRRIVRAQAAVGIVVLSLTAAQAADIFDKVDENS